MAVAVLGYDLIIASVLSIDDLIESLIQTQYPAPTKGQTKVSSHLNPHTGQLCVTEQ